jgi:hypothetical protein
MFGNRRQKFDLSASINAAVEISKQALELNFGVGIVLTNDLKIEAGEIVTQERGWKSRFVKVRGSFLGRNLSDLYRELSFEALLNLQDGRPFAGWRLDHGVINIDDRLCRVLADSRDDQLSVYLHDEFNSNPPLWISNRKEVWVGYGAYDRVPSESLRAV